MRLPDIGIKITPRDHVGNCVRCHIGIYVGDTSHRGRGIWLGLLCTDCGPTPTQTGATR